MSERPYRRTGVWDSCRRCGSAFWRRPSDGDRAFCSISCARTIHPVEDRTCRTCGATFRFHLRPSSNAAGVYCSLPCRDLGYRTGGRDRSHRSGWRSVRNRFLAANPFCSRCGRRDGRLVVHHVEPYRVSRDDRPSNLVTVCSPCHAAVERASVLIAAKREPARALGVAVVQAVLADLWHQHSMEGIR